MMCVICKKYVVTNEPAFMLTKGSIAGSHGDGNGTFQAVKNAAREFVHQACVETDKPGRGYVLLSASNVLEEYVPEMQAWERIFRDQEDRTTADQVKGRWEELRALASESSS